MVNNLGNKQTMANNIQYYMDKFGKTRHDLCNDLGFNYSTVSEWLQAKKYPRIDKIETMANYFGITKADLVEEIDHTELPPNALPVPPQCQLAVIGRVSAGSGVYAYDDILSYEFADERYCNNDYFYLKVVGDSMTPEIKDGDLVLVHKQPMIESGNYAVVLVDNEEGCVKIVKYGKDWIELHSINPYYPVRRFEKENTKLIKIIGKVIEIKRKL